MKTKYLLAAFALPMVFAACSQDEFDELSSNAPVNEGGIKVTLNLSNDLDFQSRATWDGSALGWAESDKISMYWTGKDKNTTLADQTVLNGSSNAIFKTTDGAEFTSESLVFEGKNVVVFPANEKHYTSQAIEIEVKATQDASTVNNVPFISNLLNIQANDKFTDNKPGYHQSVFAPMKLAANVVTLKLDVKNTAALEKYGFDVESVDLVATDAFTSKANVIVVDTLSQDLEQEGNQIYAKTAPAKGNDTIPTIVNSLWTKAVTAGKVSTLSSKAVVKNEDGTYSVTFVVLPTDVAAVADAKIVVNTTCGTITLGTADVDKKGNLVNYVIREAEKPAATDTVEIKDALAFFASSITMPLGTKASSFDGEKVGRTIARTIAVDASQTKLDGSKVKTSADIIRYVNLYKDMQKKDAMNLVMVVDGAKAGTLKAWAGLTKEAVDAIDAVNAVKETKDKITLTSEYVNEIQLSTVGSVYDVKAYAGDQLPLTLTTGAWTMNDTLEVNAKFTKVINKGTLTIAGTATKAGQSTMRETVENEGTINLGGNNKVWLNGSFVNAPAGKVNVAANQELTFAATNANLHGTIDVAANAFLTVADGVIATNKGVINNSGIIAAEGTEGLYNAICTEATHLDKQGKLTHTSGIINIKTADAITYVQNNAGSINMNDRNNEVVVKTNSGKIVYNYNYANDGATFEVKATDRFSYVVFGTDATAVTLKKAATNVLPIAGISMEFTGSTTLTTNAQTIAAMKVASGANLKVNSGNTLTVTGAVANEGMITIGGTINCDSYTGEGRILSVGTGAINAAN